MNNIQRAIARVTGVDEQLEVTTRALEAVASDYTLLERRIEDMGYLNLWDASQFEDILPHAIDDKTLKRIRILRHENPLAKQAVKLVIRFTLGKGVQWMVKSSPDAQMGEQPLPGSVDDEETEDQDQETETELPENVVRLRGNTPPRRAQEQEEVEAERLREVFSEFWNDPENQMTITSHEAQQQFLDDVVTDGEKFFTMFPAEGVAPYVKVSEIPMDEIKDILYDPRNRKRPVWYKRVYMEQKWNAEQDRWDPTDKPITKYYRDYRISEDDLVQIAENGLDIPEAKRGEGLVFHRGVNWLKTKKGVRGISELFASRDWFRVFKEFMQDRAAINKAATAVAYQRKIKGGPAKLAEFHNRFGGIETDSTQSNPLQVRKMTRPAAGAVYDKNESVDLEWMKTDTGASQAVQDGRAILMAGGAGVSTNIHYFGEGGDANLATAQAMELPMVKNYEDWQKFVESTFQEIFNFVAKTAFGDDYKIEPGVVSWEFPPIISKDIVKYITAWGQLVTTIAPGNLPVKIAAIRGALNDMDVPGVDQLMKQIEQHEAELQRQREIDRQRMAEIRNAGGFGGEEGEEEGPKPPAPGFAKANAAGGGNPETARLARGKPPISRPGRVES